MSVLQALRKLVLGETWALPLGVLLVLLAAFLVRDAAERQWEHGGGFALLAGVLVVLTVSVSVSARRGR